jgi:hypothetical protein
MLIGAGLSQEVGYPSWTDLLDPLRLELGIGQIADLPQLAQYYVDANGRARLDQYVRDSLAAVGDPDPTTSHKFLAQLPIDESWTTNYDSLVERAIEDAFVFIHDGQLATAEVEPERRRVNKMHGSIDPPSQIVLTRDDYDRYPDTHPRFWQLLQAQFLTKTFLFLGFGFTDPNLDVVFKLVRLHTADVKREHFAILKRPETDDADSSEQDLKLFGFKAAELRQVGVQVVEVDSYSEISTILGRLVARCRPPQLMISGSAPPEAGRSAVGGAYPTAPLSDHLVAVATAIGERLASTTIAVLGAGEPGSLVGYEMMRGLTVNGTYEPKRFTLVRRRRDSELDPPNLRLGRVVFTGDEPSDLRSAALSEVRALVVLGGSGGTRSEVDLAVDLGLGIVPVACTGGTALAYWQELKNDLGAHLLGGRSIDPILFEQLASTDVELAADAAVRLAIQALFLDGEPVD